MIPSKYGGGVNLSRAEGWTEDIFYNKGDDIGLSPSCTSDDTFSEVDGYICWLRQL